MARFPDPILGEFQDCEEFFHPFKKYLGWSSLVPVAFHVMGYYTSLKAFMS